MKTNDMEQYGFNGWFAAEAATYGDVFIGRIIAQEKGGYRAVCEGGEVAAEISGKLRFEAGTASDYPAVGDFVLLDRNTGETGNAIIQRVLPRKSLFTRKAAGKSNEVQVIAANIDTVFICMSLNNDFNLHRLERYLSLSWESGAVPVVVLTKSDLCDDIRRKLDAVESVALGVDILVTTAMEEDGYRQILTYVRPGVTIALIGSSGVGKSTLINRLVGRQLLETNGLRNDDKGRHTTTRRELFLLPGGGMVIDTPGMRELGMWDTEEGLHRSFEDVESLFGLCRFSNCTHTSEPGCAIYAAIERGDLSSQRWASYRKLKTEAVFAEDKSAYLAEKEKKFKNIARAIKTIKKR